MGDRAAPAPGPAGWAWPLYTGMAVAGSAAVVASASTLAGLAQVAGWAGWTPWLLPAALDVGGSVGGWCWLRADIPARARGFGRSLALAGATTTLVGNAAGHLISSGYLTGGPALVVIVGAVPAAVLVALVHLAALLTSSARPRRSTTARGPDHAAGGGDRRPVPVTAADTASAAADRPRGGGRDGTVGGGSVRAAVLAGLDGGPSTVADLVRATGRPRSTVVGHLTALAEAGVVARGEGKRWRRLPRPVPGDVA